MAIRPTRMLQTHLALPAADSRPRTTDPKTPPALELLTRRELEIMRLVARGLPNADMAAELVVSEHTVKTLVACVLGKLDLQNRAQAVVLAYETGLINNRQPHR